MLLGRSRKILFDHDIKREKLIKSMTKPNEGGGEVFKIHMNILNFSQAMIKNILLFLSKNIPDIV